MSKIIYVTKEALRMAFNKDYDMKLPKDTKFVLTTESDKEREQNYVADLETKLADMEQEQIAEMKEHQEAMQMADKKIKELEEQLGLSKMNESFEKEKKDNAFKFIDQLKQQLAEKERQILELQEQSIRDNQIYNEELAEKDKEIEKLQRCNDRLAQGIYHSYGEHFILKVKQNKISFCIEKLGNLKSFIKEKAKFETGDYEIVYSDDILEEIDDQIEELKRENR